MPFHSIDMLQENLNEADALEQAYTVVWWEKSSSPVVFLTRNKFTDDYAVVFRGEIFNPALPFAQKSI